MRRSLTAAIVLVLTLCAAGEGLAGDSFYQGTAGNFESFFALFDFETSYAVVHAAVTHTQAYDTRGVVGWSEPQPFYGVGVHGIGGFVGVQGGAQISGEGARYGVLGRGENGTVFNYGVWGNASGPAGSLSYGVYGKGPIGSGGAAVYASGDLEYTGSLVGPVSDLRLKQNLAAAGSSLPRIMDLEVVSYEHTRDPEFSHINLPEGPQVGFVAQQVAEVFPDLVTEMVHPKTVDPERKELAVEESEPTRLLALKQMNLIPHLVRAIQEQQAQIEALQAQLGPLQQRLAALEVGPQEAVVLASAK